MLKMLNLEKPNINIPLQFLKTLEFLGKGWPPKKFGKVLPETLKTNIFNIPGKC